MTDTVRLDDVRHIPDMTIGPDGGGLTVGAEPGHTLLRGTGARSLVWCHPERTTRVARRPFQSTAPGRMTWTACAAGGEGGHRK